ncbi:putative nuclease HARBI1 [Trichonephila clavipes]|nr:putative nuclease HARBI1 [Trichonephila clavipes]
MFVKAILAWFIQPGTRSLCSFIHTIQRGRIKEVSPSCKFICLSYGQRYESTFALQPNDKRIMVWREQDTRNWPENSRIPRWKHHDLELIRRQNAKRKKRKVWVKPWVGRRTEYGASHTLLKELKNEDHTAYRNMLRITGEQFDELLEMVRGKLSKQDTTMRMAIPVTTKLEITLRYLATGDSFKSLEYLFRVPETTISRFLPHVLTEICCVLRPFINVPTTVEKWKKIEKVFLQRWNFPRCCGAIDGKHVLIKRPPGSGSVYYNYKKTYSIILFAMVDADYCFTYVDVRGNGRANDSAVFRNSSLNIAMENKANWVS